MSKYRYQESEYKKRLRKEFAEQAIIIKGQKQQAIEARDIFFDETQEIEARIEAAKLMGSFTKSADIEKGKSIFRDKSQSEIIRSYAFSSVAGLVLSDETMMKEAISTLKAGEGEGSIALSALGILQLAEISSPVKLEPNTAAYKDALRSVVNHKNKNLRAVALEILAMEKDGYAQRLLIESLEKPGDDLIEPEIAIQLLAFDLHTNHYPVFRKVVKNPPNSIAKREALRNLGADIESKDLLLETIRNTGEDAETRHAAVTALSSQSPELTIKEAKKIIISEKEEHLDELKTALLNTMIYTEKASTSERGVFVLEQMEDADDFAKQLQDLNKSSNSMELQDMISLYLNNRK